MNSPSIRKCVRGGCHWLSLINIIAKKIHTYTRNVLSRNYWGRGGRDKMNFKQRKWKLFAVHWRLQGCCMRTVDSLSKIFFLIQDIFEVVQWKYTNTNNEYLVYTYLHLIEEFMPSAVYKYATHERINQYKQTNFYKSKHLHLIFLSKDDL